MFSLVSYQTFKSIKHTSERITKAGKKMINELDYEDIKFPVCEKDFSKFKKKNNISINVFCYENKLNYTVYVSDQEFKNCLDLLMISHKNI